MNSRTSACTVRSTATCPIIPAERAQWLARRKELYEAQHPETKAGTAGAHGTNRKLGKGDATADSATASFVADTASKTRRGARTVYEDVAIGTKLTPAAAEIIRGTPVEDRKATFGGWQRRSRTPEGFHADHAIPSYS